MLNLLEVVDLHQVLTPETYIASELVVGTIQSRVEVLYYRFPLIEYK